LLKKNGGSTAVFFTHHLPILISFIYYPPVFTATKTQLMHSATSIQTMREQAKPGISASPFHFAQSSDASLCLSLKTVEPPPDNSEQDNTHDCYHLMTK